MTIEKEAREELIRRFSLKYSTVGACWVWNASKIKYRKLSYGQMWHFTKNEMAHRMSYKLFVGDIPQGFTVDHICKNTLCVNPDHLRILTLKENIMLGNSACAVNAKKTKCPRGHNYDGKNKNGRYCKTCKHRWDREYSMRVTAKKAIGGGNGND